MRLILLFCLFSCVYLSNGKDIEVETVVHLGDNIIKKMEGAVDKIKNFKTSDLRSYQQNIVNFVKDKMQNSVSGSLNSLLDLVRGNKKDLTRTRTIQKKKCLKRKNATTHENEELMSKHKNKRFKSTAPTYKDNVELTTEETMAAEMGNMIKSVQRQKGDQHTPDLLSLIGGVAINNFDKIRDTLRILNKVLGGGNKKSRNWKPHFHGQEGSQEYKDEPTPDNILEVTGEGVTFELIQHLATRGVKDLKSRGIYLTNQLFLGTEALNVDHFINRYLEKMKQYFEHIINKIKNKIVSDFDEEMVQLDMIEASNSILYEEQKRMVDVLIQNTTITDNDMDMLVETMKRENIDNKKREMRHLCLSKEICRTYPGFSDYLADLIIEVMKLPDEKLAIFTKTAIKHVKNKAKFLKTLARKKDVMKIAEKLESLPSIEYYLTRESFSIARSVITQRNKLFNSDNKMLKRKTVAIRMLLDIIDKAFERDGEDLMSIMFETMTSAIRSWAADLRNDIDTILSNFINKFFVTCETNWNYEIIGDIQIIVDVILRGKSTDSEFESKLVVSGSKYLKKPEDLFYDAI